MLLEVKNKKNVLSIAIKLEVHISSESESCSLSCIF